MSKKDFKLIPQKPPYPYLKEADRAGLVPEQGYCSIYPSKTYTDGLVVSGSGNKVYVYGDPYTEKMLFEQEELVYCKIPFPAAPPDLQPVLPELRRLLREGRDEEADQLAMKAAEGSNPMFCADKPPVRNHSRHSACMMLLDTPMQPGTRDYLRVMDYANGQGSVRWENDCGAFARHSIASVRGTLFAHRIVTLRGEPAPYRIAVSTDSGNTSQDIWEKRDTAINVTSHPGRLEHTLYVGCKYDPACMGKEGFAVFTKVVAKDGVVSDLTDGFFVSGAPVFEVFNQVIHYPDFTLETLRRDAEAFRDATYTYDSLLAENQAQLAPMMKRSALHIMPESERLLSTEELLHIQHSSDICLGLMQRLYDAGRYFFITETGKYPPAGGQYNININLQICSANPTGLFEKMKVFFDFIESKFPDFRDNARYLLGCRGILASVHPDMRTGHSTHFGHDYPHQFWIACTAWIYNEFWNYYLVTGDKDFLREHVVPGLQEIALFYEDFLQDKDANGNYIFYPCFSPEDSPMGQSPVSINAAIDIMGCREVLENLLRACEILEIHPAGMERWREILDHLPSYLLDEEGGLKEWAWEGTVENLNHRHVSHHYDAWPGHAVTWEDTPALAKAIQISNRKRGQQNDSAHGILHRLLTAIRLKDTDDAWQNLKQILDHGFVRPNLMGNHFPHKVYFADTTGSLPAIMDEMLVFSDEGVVEFLPALPPFFQKGAIEGLWTFAAAKINRMEWDLEQKTVKAELVSLREQELLLRARSGFRRLSVGGNTVAQSGTDVTVPFQKGVPVAIELEYQ